MFLRDLLWQDLMRASQTTNSLPIMQHCKQNSFISICASRKLVNIIVSVKDYMVGLSYLCLSLSASDILLPVYLSQTSSATI